MRKMILTALFVATFFLSGVANAATITLTLPEYSSPQHAVGTYYDPYLVGTFNFDLTGQYIVSAEISGQWGNNFSPTTAHNLLFVDYLQIADTHDYTPDPYYNGPTPWSYTFSDFSVLNDGIAEFWTVQTSEYFVRLGETTLNIETASSVPEPSAILLLGFGLAGVGLFRKRFKN